jgi:hypothetical protein
VVDGRCLRADLDVDRDPVQVGVDGAGACGRPHGRLRREHHVARRRRGARGQFTRGRHRVVGDLQCQAVSHRGFSVEPHPEQQRRPGHLRADRPLQHPGRPAAGMDAEFLESGVEQRGGTRDPHVGRQRQVESGADCGTVDRSDGRQRALRDGKEAVVDHPEAVRGCGAQCGEVGARAERLPGSGDDHRVHVDVRLGGVDGRAKSSRDLGRHRIAAIGIVDGDEGDAVFYLHQYEIGHGSRLVTWLEGATAGLTALAGPPK